MNKTTKGVSQNLKNKLEKSINTQKNSKYSCAISICTFFGSIFLMFSNLLFQNNNYRLFVQFIIIMFTFWISHYYNKKTKNILDNKKQIHINTTADDKIERIANNLAYLTPLVLFVTWFNTEIDEYDILKIIFIFLTVIPIAMIVILENSRRKK